MSSSVTLAQPAVNWDLQHPAPLEVGRALVNYSSTEIRRIKGLKSSEIHEALGYADSSYVALRENIAFFGAAGGSRPATPALAGGGVGLE